MIRVIDRCEGSRWLKRALFMLTCLLIAACGKTWQAPYESRTSGHTTESARVISSRQQREKPVQVAPIQNQKSVDSKETKTTREQLTLYKVRTGDTLYSIGRKYGVSHTQIIKWNNLQTASIRVGQTLKIGPPQTMDSKISEVAVKPVTPAKSGKTAQLGQPRPKQVTGPIPDAPTKLKDNLRWRWPVKGKVVKTFNAKDPTRKGIRVRGSEGKTIRAAEGGTVV